MKIQTWYLSLLIVLKTGFAGTAQPLHVFSAQPPYQQLTTIPLQDMRGWITFSIDGKYAYPSSGEVIEVKTRRILTTLTDEFNNSVESEKMPEIGFKGNKPVQAGNQFGIGRMP